MGDSLSKENKTDLRSGNVNIHYGKQKFEISQELTLQNCMQLCTLLNLRPADRDRVQRSETPGIELLQILEERGLYGDGNCQFLRTALDRIGMKRVALILQPSEKMLSTQELSEKRTMLTNYLKLRYKDIYKIRHQVGSSESPFMDLDLALLDAKKGRREDAKLITFTSYLDVFTNSSLKKEMRIVIEGEPGFGKTTLACQLAYSWSIATAASPLSEIDIMIFLQMGKIHSPSVYEAIKHILPIDCHLTSDDIRAVLQQTSSLVLTLDGWDEFMLEGPTCNPSGSDFNHIANNMMLTHAKAIITTRPCCSEVRKFPAVRLRLNELRRDQRQSYITEKFPNQEKEAKETMAFIEENEFLLSLCGIPILFNLLLNGLVEDNLQNSNLGLNRVTVLFQRVLECLTSHLTRKEPHTSEELSTSDLDKLCEIACSGILSQPPQTTWDSKLFEDFNCLQFWTKTGILVKENTEFDSSSFMRFWSSDAASSPSAFVRFFHGMFQEWFASNHLSRLAKEDLTSFTNTLKKLSPIHFESLFPFICGLAPSATYHIIDHLLTLKDEFPYPIMDCMFQCFYEHDDDKTPLLDLVKKICQKPISIYNRNSRILQSAKVSMLTIASQNKIPISKVNLVGVVTEINEEGITFKSGLRLPPLLTVESYVIIGYKKQRSLSCDDLLHYVGKSQSLHRAWLYLSSRWPAVHSSSVSTRLSVHEDTKVFLCINGKKWYILDLEEGKWLKQKEGKAKRNKLGETHLLDNLLSRSKLRKKSLYRPLLSTTSYWSERLYVYSLREHFAR